MRSGTVGVPRSLAPCLGPAFFRQSEWATPQGEHHSHMLWDTGDSAFHNLMEILSLEVLENCLCVFFPQYMQMFWQAKGKGDLFF